MQPRAIGSLRRFTASVVVGLLRELINDRRYRETQTARPPLTFARPPWESYVRTTIGFAGFTIEPGIERRPGDDFDYIVKELGHVVRDWCEVARDPIVNAESIGNGLCHRWPERAYFVEVWQTGRNGWAQIFQPYGIPRNDRAR